jgi:carboxyl-terminal processing protease
MRAARAAALAAALLVVLCAGIWLGGHPSRLPSIARDHLVGSPGGLLAEGAEAVEDNYYRDVGGTELANSSLQGMVRELRRRFHDRFSEYFSPQNLERFDEEIGGRFSGIGLSVVGVKAGLRVTHVFPHSPAQRADIGPGETIVGVDGEPLAGVDSNAATAKIKGPEGTEVAIQVRSPGGKVRSLELTRAEVKLPITGSRTVSEGRRLLGHVRLLAFSEGAHAALAEAVRKVEREGAEGIVLDLRGNGGGLLEEAVLSASLFMPEGRVVVSTDSRTQGHAVYKTLGGRVSRLPLVVLIDRGTASAAEILAAALADDVGAKVVGTRSYGKGVFQQEVALANGGALKLTVGEYFTPDGVNLARTGGIHPDVRARDDPHTRSDEGLDAALGALAPEVDG